MKNISDKIYQIIFLFFAFFFLSPLLLLAQQNTQIELQISQNTVTIGETFQIVLSLKQASTTGINISNLQIPGLENFKQIGNSTSTQIRMINGVTAAVSNNTKTLVALKEGNFQIGPVTIPTNNQDKIQSNILNLTVNTKLTKNQNPPPSKNSSNLTTSSPKTNFKKNFNSIKKTLNWLLGIVFMIFAYYLYLYSKKQENQKTSTLETHHSENNSIKYPDIQAIDFYPQVKTIVLKYLEQKTGKDYTTFTTQEIMQELPQKNLFYLDKIKFLLEAVDQNKFSKVSGDKEKVLESLKLIK